MTLTILRVFTRHGMYALPKTIIADRAGVTCQHIFDLSIREGQPGFAAHLLPDVIHTADHAEVQTVRGVSRRDGVVDAHEVHHPAPKSIRSMDGSSCKSPTSVIRAA